MKNSKEELKKSIEDARAKLNQSIERHESYEMIYQRSTELDQLIELYIVCGY